MMRPPPERVRISVIIPVRNKVRFIERCIGSVVEAIGQAPDIDVVIVENGSSDGSGEVLDRLFADRATIIRSKSRTAAAARNEGACLATGSILCFLDADVIVPPDFFGRVTKVFGMPQVAAAGCTVALSPDGWISAVWDALHDRGITSVTRLINAADFCVRRDVFRQVGGFDGDLITGEDADICLRLVESGHLLLEAQTLKVVHVDNPRTLVGFVRKEIWRGLGALATFRVTRIDRPLIMTLGHGLLLLLGTTSLVLGGFGLRHWFMFLISTSLVPLIAVHYRRVLAHQAPAIGPAVVLYQAYFLARLVSLVRLLTGRHSETGDA